MLSEQYEDKVRYALDMAQRSADLETRRQWLFVASEWFQIARIGQEGMRLHELGRALGQASEPN